MLYWLVYEAVLYWASVRFIMQGADSYNCQIPFPIYANNWEFTVVSNFEIVVLELLLIAVEKVGKLVP
jgi:hypothetical protein